MTTSTDNVIDLSERRRAKREAQDIVRAHVICDDDDAMRLVAHLEAMIWREAEAHRPGVER